MPNPTLLTCPFAENGAKNTIPDDGANFGYASQSQGFPPETSVPIAAGGVAPKREDFNGALNLLSNINFYTQKGWEYEYDGSQDYLTGCVVVDPATGGLYECTHDAPVGTVAPSEDSNNIYWRPRDIRLKRNTAYAVGDIATSNYLPSYYFLRCTEAGITAAVLPQAIQTVAEGDFFADGAAVWSVQKVASLADLVNAARHEPDLAVSEMAVTVTGINSIKNIDVSYKGGGSLSVVSSNEAVCTASVEGNIITLTAISEGAAIITVKLSATELYFGDSLDINANVTAKYSANLTLSNDVVNQKVSQSQTITATYAGDGILSVSTSNNAVATASLNGNVITVSGVADGAAIIYVSTSETDTYFSDTVQINVTIKDALYPNLTLSASTAKINVGKFVNITATYAGNGELTAVSSNSNVVSVSVNNKTLTLLGVSNGTATITVKVSETATYYADSTSIAATAVTYKKMTVNIDLTNSNPATCCTYADDAVNMTAGSAAWDEFFGHYPCLFKNGVEVGKLKRGNFAQFEDGTAADITSGNAGDVMIAFPRRGLTITTSADGNTLTVSMTDNLDDSNFKYLAHKRANTQKNTFYVSAYEGCVLNNKMRSLSGQSPVENYLVSEARTYAQANGAGYEMFTFYQITYIQAMYILKFKNLDSQAVIGRGRTNISSSNFLSTGTLNSAGMESGNVDAGNSAMKLFGIENFWGNTSCFMDGLYTFESPTNTVNILTATDGFSNTGEGYTPLGTTPFANGNIKTVQGTTERGFYIKTGQGSVTTFFCDRCDWCAINNKLGTLFGGYYNSNQAAGIFCQMPLASTSSANSRKRNSRISYY